MKYNQPFGISDPNAPYINGNPSTGTMGSIPPAASIEYPQREIVNLITHANLAAPSDADLNQLARAVQSNLLYSDNDAGTANQYQVTQAPAPTAYFPYMTVVMKVLNANTGPSTVNVNALGAKPIVRIDNTPLLPGDLIAGSIVCLIYDGISFQTVWSSRSTGASGGGGILTANTTLYVNTTTGHDTNYDGTSATFVSGTKGPFKTIQRAIDEAFKFQASALYTMTIQIADGTYTESVTTPWTTGPTLVVRGNATTPANVHLVAPVGLYHCFALNGPNVCTLRDLKWTTTNVNTAGIGANGSGANLSTINTESGPCATWCMLGNGLGSVTIAGAHKFTGNMGYGFSAYRNGTVNFGGGFVLTISASITVSVFAYVVSGGQIEVPASNVPTWSGAGSVTGTRYSAVLNGVINTQGAGATYFPGTIAGSTASGGQYA